MSFKSLGLTPALCATLEKKGYKTPTPIQTKAIPEILKGQDVLAGAQTGTGKTAAFALPMLQQLSAHITEEDDKPRGLILVPTRELAVQVERSISEYAIDLPIKSVALYGGERINFQKNRLKAGVNIVVATPGRLFDHISAKNVDLSAIDMFVLDEADRMLDMGFITDIKKILRVIPHYRQTMLFSATYNKGIRSIATTVLRDPVRIEAASRNEAAANVTQSVYPILRERKKLLLTHIIKDQKLDQVLVFTRTKRNADEVARELRDNRIRATAIHSDKNQFERARALESFKAGKMRVLVATDIAARGLDIDALPHVINYELPELAEDYIHRIGRTGRAGQTGVAISFVADHEKKQLLKIEQMLSKAIERKYVPGIKKLAVTTQAEKKHDREMRKAKKDPFASASIMRNKRKAKGDAPSSKPKRSKSSTKTNKFRKPKKNRRTF